MHRQGGQHAGRAGMQVRNRVQNAKCVVFFSSELQEELENCKQNRKHQKSQNQKMKIKNSKNQKVLRDALLYATFSSVFDEMFFLF